MKVRIPMLCLAIISMILYALRYGGSDYTFSACLQSIATNLYLRVARGNKQSTERRYQMNMNGDLTKDSPTKAILLFALPMLFGVVFQQLYHVADGVIVGRFISMDALAAVSISYPFTALFLGIAAGGSAGAAILISYHFGSKQMDEMMTAVRTAVLSFLFCAVILALGGFLLDRSILSLLDTPDGIYHTAKIYLDIFLGSLPFVFLYNITNACFQALGNSLFPLILLIASSILNVLLDLWWVAVLNRGIGGAAAATLVSQMITALIAFALLWHRLRAYRCLGKRFSKDAFLRLVRYAVPGMLQQSVVAIGQLFMQNRINGFGTAVIAGHAAAFKINTIVMAAVNALGNALSGFTSQNLGAEKPQRILKGYRSTLSAVLGMCACIAAASILSGRFFISAFMEKPVNRQALDTGIYFLHVVSPFYLLLAYKMCTDCLLKGLGNMKAFTAATILDLCTRVGFAFLFAAKQGYAAICFAYPAGWIVGLTVTLLSFFRERRNLS